MSKPSPFKQFVQAFRATIATSPDQRKGKNKHYTLGDAAVGACAIFFTQSPSFLAYPRDLKARKGQSNAHPLFGIHEIPSDHQIRALRAPVSPELRVPLFHQGVATWEHTPQLETVRSWQKRGLVVVEGTHYFSSQKISCPPCSPQTPSPGAPLYSPRRLTPGRVAPGQDKGIPWPPEFLVPQEGQDKQDGENAAAKRWLRPYASPYRSKGSTIWGEDLYAPPPLWAVLIEEKLPLILVCKPASPPPRSERRAGLAPGQALPHVTHRHHPSKGLALYTYRYAPQLPLRATAATLHGKWCELRSTTEQGAGLSQKAFVTQEPITQKTVAQIVPAGRTRWKVENETNHTLKTKGSHLEHNFGHGHQPLAALLATFHLLAFLFHPLLDLVDAK